MTRTAGFLGTAAVVLVLSACGPRAVPNTAPALTAAEKAGYLPSPEIVSVGAATDGAPVVRGRAKPAGRVRATLPSGEAYGATADAQGRFELGLPNGGGAVMAAISAEEGGRSTPAEGWLFAPPGDYRHAALLRAGTASRALAQNPGLIAIVDIDAGGGAGVSGEAPVGAEVKLFLDGALTGSVRASDQGRFSLRLGRASTGVHRLRVTAAGQSQERHVDLTAAAPTGTGSPYAAVRVTDGWRVDWTPPGGGAQTTYVFSGGAS